MIEKNRKICLFYIFIYLFAWTCFGLSLFIKVKDGVALPVNEMQAMAFNEIFNMVSLITALYCLVYGVIAIVQIKGTLYKEIAIVLFYGVVAGFVNYFVVVHERIEALTLFILCKFIVELVIRLIQKLISKKLEEAPEIIEKVQ